MLWKEAGCTTELDYTEQTSWLLFLKYLVYDITFRFAHKYLSSSDRTVDQMIQSARSCKQNILEGSKAATTSKETEIKLTNVGRASLEELLANYRNYSRVRDLRIWDKDSKEALFVRDLGRQTPQTFDRRITKDFA